MTLGMANKRRPKLAQELIDHILDHIHYDSEALKRCALVSKSFLPTSQRHLFSTFEISGSNLRELVRLFRSPVSDEERAALRARVTDLLNTHTTDLTLTFPNDSSPSLTRTPYLPEFKNVQRVTFKGQKMVSDLEIPHFLSGTWTSPAPDCKISSVGFDFQTMGSEAILKSLYALPATVENVSFTSKDTYFPGMSAASFRRDNDNGQGVRCLDGTLRLHLATDTSHEEFLSLLLELGDSFKFNLKRINYRVAVRDEIPPLASLVGECKGTLESLDIVFTSMSYNDRGEEVQSFDFSSHRALRRIRIWTSADINPSWLPAAIRSIPKPSSANPRVPPLQIGLYISLPDWMVYPRASRREPPGEVDNIVTPWIAVDAQLSRLMGLSPDAPSETSMLGGTTGGISLDVSVTYVGKGTGNRAPALMFPLLSGASGFLRLV